MRLKTLIVALILIMSLPLAAKAQISFQFRDSLGSYKVEFTPHVTTDAAARRLGKPLIAPATEFRLGTAFCAYTPSGYTTDSWWDPSNYQYLLGNEPQVRMPRWFTLGAECGYWFKDWFYVGGTFVWTGGFSRKENYQHREVLGYYKYNSFTLMPMVRFAWLRRGIVQLYSSLGLGLNLAHVEEPIESDLDNTYMEGVIAYDVTFFGISVGRNLFGYLDVGAGQRGAVSVGIGYRFNNKK